MAKNETRQAAPIPWEALVLSTDGIEAHQHMMDAHAFARAHMHPWPVSLSLVDLLRRLVFRVADEANTGYVLDKDHHGYRLTHPIRTPFVVNNSCDQEHEKLVTQFRAALQTEIDNIVARRVDREFQVRAEALLRSTINTYPEEYYETITVTMNGTKVRLAFVPTPEITSYQFYQCRKLLDGLIQTPSYMAWIMDNNLLDFWQEITDTGVKETSSSQFALWWKGFQQWVCGSAGLKKDAAG